MRAIPNLPWTALPPTLGVSGKLGQLHSTAPVSDCKGELVEGGRHSPSHWRRNRPLVVASPEVLHEGMPSDDHPGAGVLLESAYRSQPRLETAMDGLDPVLAYRFGAMPRRWEQLLEHHRMVAARSLTTSAGVTLVVSTA